jgi:hypothetical protein
MGFTQASSKTVGHELAAVLPTEKPWYKNTGLLKLNFCLFSLIQFSSANGYDGSMMNGLQIFPIWHTFMNNPAGAWLGFINAVSTPLRTQHFWL